MESAVWRLKSIVFVSPVFYQEFSNGFDFWSFCSLRSKAAFTQELWNSFRIATDRLPVYTVSWNRSVQNHSFPCIHA